MVALGYNLHYHHYLYELVYFPSYRGLIFQYHVILGEKYLQAWATSQDDGWGTWKGQGVAGRLMHYHSPPSPYFAWMATNMCIYSRQRSLEIPDSSVICDP